MRIRMTSGVTFSVCLHRIIDNKSCKKLHEKRPRYNYYFFNVHGLEYVSTWQLDEEALRIKSAGLANFSLGQLQPKRPRFELY